MIPIENIHQGSLCPFDMFISCGLGLKFLDRKNSLIFMPLLLYINVYHLDYV